MSRNRYEFCVLIKILTQKELNISRNQYVSFRKIFRMLESYAQFFKLSESYVTLKNHINRQLSLLQMRKKTIFLRSKKMTTATEKRKKSDSTIERIFTKNLIFFDFKHVFQMFLSSKEYRKKMHIKMTKFVDVFCELWHFYSWISFVKITSEEFAHYFNSKSIFSSNFVYFLCANSDCEKQHMKRVYEVNRDFRFVCLQSEIVIIQIQEMILESAFHFDFFFEFQKLLLISIVHEIIESNVLSRIENVTMNYNFENLKINTHSSNIRSDFFMIKRMLKNSKFRSIYHISSLKIELKIREFTRNHFVQNFRHSCISISLFIFIDDFDLYRNNYRSLMNMYVIVTALIFKKRTRRANVFSLIFEFHESNFSDVIEALKFFISLNEDMKLMINEQKTFVCVFTLTYIDDMSQQQKNSEFKNQRATLKCRFCFISINERQNLNYNIIENDRFHHQTVQMRKNMNKIKQISR